MTLVFRPAQGADSSFLSDLAREAFGRYGDYAPVVADWAADPWGEVTIAEQDGTRVGAAFLLFLRPSETPDTPVADLIALAVAAPFRGRGLGAVLLGNVVERARAVARRRGVATLRLTVAESNVSARRMFEKAGFRYDRADVAGSYPEGQKALHMSLCLGGGAPAAG